MHWGWNRRLFWVWGIRWPGAALCPPLCIVGTTSRTRSDTYVAAWVEAGITDGYKISRYLGHGTPASAYRLYGHLLPNDESKVTAKLSAARAKAGADVAGVGCVPALLASVGPP